MDRSVTRDVIARCPGNPVVSLADMPFPCSDIWNAAVVRFEGRVLLLITIETLDGRYSIYRADSDDGEHFTVEAEPFMAPLDDGPHRQYEWAGVRDPRITLIDGVYYIAYVAVGDHGLRVGLAKTTDFRAVERLEYVSQVDVKNGALFPRQIGGEYVLLERPNAGSSIWMLRSPDLRYWGDPVAVMTPRGGYWDAHLIGAAGPPIEIDAGWLLIYYGEKHTSGGPLVRLGAAVLDRDDPARVLARSNIPILSPREPYERIGDVPNVVFSCGTLVDDGVVNVIYGASDSCICRGTAPLEDILRSCFDSGKEF